MAYTKKVKSIVKGNCGITLSPDRIVKPYDMTTLGAVKIVSLVKNKSTKRENIVELQSSKTKFEPILELPLNTANDCKESLKSCLIYMDQARTIFSETGSQENIYALNRSMNHIDFAIKAFDLVITNSK
jgi:hypothetical protein